MSRVATVPARAYKQARPFTVSIQALITAMLALMLAPFATAQARRDRAGAAPPPVVPQTIEMRRGEQIAVPLAIYGARGETLEFLIRTPPAHGRLSAVKNTGLNAATVTYISSARGTADTDRFAYAARSSEGVSAPGLITIRFVEPVVMPAKLKAPLDLEFPPVFPGQRSTVEMELANQGGGVIEGDVAVPEPWSIEGLKIFRLGAGQRTTFKIVFTPAEPGIRTGEAVISGPQRKLIPLRASAEVRLAATPTQLKLTAQPGSQTRMGVLKIANHSEEDATVTVDAGARLLTDRVVKVPARGSSAVPVFADAVDAAAFDDVVKLSSKEWKATVPVRAVAVGPILKFTAPEVNITGSDKGLEASGLAILENAGGEPVTVRLDVGRPFALEARVATAPARGRVEIPILVRDSGPGTFRSSLKATGDGGSAVVAVKAEIAEALAVQTKASAPETQVEKEEPAAAPDNDARDTTVPEIPTDAREVPNGLGKLARNIGMNSASLDWPLALGPADNVRVEERVLSFAEGDTLQVGWSPLPNVSIAPSAERVVAELRGLKPGTFYTVRVVSGKDAEAAVLFTADFWTPAKKPFFTGSLLTPLLVCALFLLALAVWRSRRAPAAARK